jgi:hypothetical protein
MRVRWTVEAASDLENIAEYLFDRTPERAAEIVRNLFTTPDLLKTFPHRGRPPQTGDARMGGSLPPLHRCLPSLSQYGLHRPHPARCPELAQPLSRMLAQISPV